MLTELTGQDLPQWIADASDPGLARLLAGQRTGVVCKTAGS